MNFSASSLPRASRQRAVWSKNGSQRSFYPLMKAWILVLGSLAEPSDPRWMAWRSILPIQASRRLGQEADGGVKWAKMRGFFSSQVRTSSDLQVTSLSITRCRSPLGIRKSTNSWWRCRGFVAPVIFPVGPPERLTGSKCVPPSVPRPALLQALLQRQHQRGAGPRNASLWELSSMQIKASVGHHDAKLDSVPVARILHEPGTRRPLTDVSAGQGLEIWLPRLDSNQ